MLTKSTPSIPFRMLDYFEVTLRSCRITNNNFMTQTLPRMLVW